MSIRILHIADTHIGADLPKRGGGLPRRGADLVASYRRVLARAAELGVDAVIHAGDLFDTPRPGPGAIAAATQPLYALAAGGKPVFIVPGNHERSILPGALWLSHPLIHVFERPRTFVLERRGLRCALAGFPCLRRAAAAEFAAAVSATEWSAARADVNLLVVHETFAGARCGPANYLFWAGPDVVRREEIPAGFHYVAAGHIHRHQCLESEAGGPPIVYAGSADRVAFAELGEPKGCVLLDLKPGAVRWRYCEHSVRPMALVSVDISGLDGAEIRARVLAAVADLPERAVAQLRLTGRTTRRTPADLRLTAAVRARRPDLLATVATRAVEWISERIAFRTARRGGESAFAVLDAPAAPVAAATCADVAKLPTGFGTYALYDAAGRLLYVGKARHARARIRAHLRGDGKTGYFANWASQIAHIEVRPAYSDLETQLVEAELVRRLGPSFNQQMRQWKRYVYICAGAKPFGQLVISAAPLPRHRCWGPFRSRAGAAAGCEALTAALGCAACPDPSPGSSESLPLLGRASAALLCGRYFAGRCTGPCAGRVAGDEYAERIAARDAFLAGDDHPRLAALDMRLAEITAGVPAPAAGAAPAPDSAEPDVELVSLASLRQAARQLRAARELQRGVLLLPGAPGQMCVAALTRTGLHLIYCAPEASGAELHAWHVGLDRGRAGASATGDGVSWIAKPAADLLCVAARELTHRPGEYRFICTRPGPSSAP